MYTWMIICKVIIDIINCFSSPLGVADCIGPDASHEFNGLRLRHFLDRNLTLSNSIDEHGRAGTCRHVGTFQEIDLMV